MKKIISLQNPVIKNLKRLQKQENYRKKQGLVVVEGEKEIEIAQENLELVNYFFSPKLTQKQVTFKGNLEKNIELSKSVFQAVSYRGNPDGHLAIFKEKTFSLNDVKLSKNPLLLVLDGIEKPSNLGAVSRTACAARVDVIILVDSQIDIYNSNAIRSSTGHVFKNKIVSASFKEVSTWLKQKNIKVLATTGEARMSYTKTKLNTPLALVFGSEDKGLKNNWLELADEKIKIPMLTNMDSLNLSVSVAIMLFESLRQRKSI